MGEMTKLLPQGPHQHCGNQVQHAKHANQDPGFVLGSYCNGVPELGSFVELTVRVPLSPMSGVGVQVTSQELADMGYDGVLAWILDEGLGTFIWDELEGEHTRAVLRLRCAGQDKVHPLRAGRLLP